MVGCGGIYLQHIHFLIANVKHLVMLYYKPLSGDGIIVDRSFVEEITAATPTEVVSNSPTKEIKLQGLYNKVRRLNTNHHGAHQTVYKVVCGMLSKCPALEHITLDSWCLPTTSFFETSSRFSQVMITCWTQLQAVICFVRPAVMSFCCNLLWCVKKHCENSYSISQSTPIMNAMYVC